VREFLERDVMEATDRRIAFHARVAANVLGMVERELELGPDLDVAEHARLVKLLGRDGTIRELTEILAGDIRSGAMDTRWSETVDHVRATVRSKLEVANPRHLET
jgi:hypothetical protein